MKSEVYKCDLCKATKGEVNHWFVATSFGSKAELVQVETWSETAADARGTSHLCGRECVQKFMDAWMAKP